jgi:hypothetical protein
MKRFLALALFLVAFAACDRGELKRDWDKRDSRVKQLDADLRELAAKIKEVAGKPECEKSSDCRLIGLGAKVCENYRDFLVYSAPQAQEDKLLPYVAEFNQLAQEQYNLSLSVSNCGKPMAKVACIDGGCMPMDPNAVLNPRDGGAPVRPKQKK